MSPMLTPYRSLKARTVLSLVTLTFGPSLMVRFSTSLVMTTGRARRRSVQCCTTVSTMPPTPTAYPMSAPMFTFTGASLDPDSDRGCGVGRGGIEPPTLGLRVGYLQG